MLIRMGTEAALRGADKAAERRAVAAKARHTARIERMLGQATGRAVDWWVYLPRERRRTAATAMLRWSLLDSGTVRAPSEALASIWVATQRPDPSRVTWRLLLRARRALRAAAALGGYPPC